MGGEHQNSPPSLFQRCVPLNCPLYPLRCIFASRRRSCAVRAAGQGQCHSRCFCKFLSCTTCGSVSRFRNERTPTDPHIHSAVHSSPGHRFDVRGCCGLQNSSADSFVGGDCSLVRALRQTRLAPLRFHRMHDTGENCISAPSVLLPNSK